MLASRNRSVCSGCKQRPSADEVQLNMHGSDVRTSWRNYVSVWSIEAGYVVVNVNRFEPTTGGHPPKTSPETWGHPRLGSANSAGALHMHRPSAGQNFEFVASQHHESQPLRATLPRQLLSSCHHDTGSPESTLTMTAQGWIAGHAASLSGLQNGRSTTRRSPDG